jgi:isopentenyldiphosphate isomerase
MFWMRIEIKPGGSLRENSYSLLVPGEYHLKEELGIDVDPEKRRLLKSFKIVDDRCFFADIWSFEHDVDLSQVACQPEEVTKAKLVSKDEILEMVNEGTFAMNWFVLECLESLK